MKHRVPLMPIDLDDQDSSGPTMFRLLILPEAAWCSESAKATCSFRCAWYDGIIPHLHHKAYFLERKHLCTAYGTSSQLHI